MTEKNPALNFQARTDHTAEGDRALLETLCRNGGVPGSGDLVVTQHTPNMSVNVAAGTGFVIGTESAQQGAYHVWNDATVNLAISAADLTNPRRDIIVARVRDAAYSGATNAWALEVITGSPAPSPADPTIPDNCLQLARVAVAASAASIVTANITDLRRRLAPLGGTEVCTSTTRPSAPAVGDKIYELDTKKTYLWQGSTLGWSLEWGLPWGYIGIGQATSNQATFTAVTDITSCSVTWTAVAGRRYKLTAALRAVSSVADDTIQATITTSANAGVAAGAHVSHTNTGAASTFIQAIVAPGAGSVTYKLRGERVTGGTGNITATASSGGPNFLMVEDIGPT